MTNETTDWRVRARDRLATKQLPRPDVAPEPYPSLDSWKARLERHRSTLAETFAEEWHYLVTVQFNAPTSERLYSDCVRRLAARCDRYWLGKYWCMFPSARRTGLFGMAELGIANSGNGHLHLLVRRPGSVTIRESWKNGLTSRFGGVSAAAVRSRNRIRPTPLGKSGPCLHLHFEHGVATRISPEEQARRRAEATKRREVRPTTHDAEHLTREFTAWGRRVGVCPKGDIVFEAIGDDETDRVRVAAYVLKKFSAGRNPLVIRGQEFHPAASA